MLAIAFRLYDSIILEGVTSIQCIMVLNISHLFLEIFFLIPGLLRLRNGFRIKINSKEHSYYNPISTLVINKKVKPTMLRSKKEDINEIMNNVLAVLAKIRYNSVKK